VKADTLVLLASTPSLPKQKRRFHSSQLPVPLPESSRISGPTLFATAEWKEEPMPTSQRVIDIAKTLVERLCDGQHREGKVTYEIDPGSFRPISQCKAGTAGFAFSVTDTETDEAQGLRIVFDIKNWTVWLSNGFNREGDLYTLDEV